MLLTRTIQKWLLNFYKDFDPADYSFYWKGFTGLILTVFRHKPLRFMARREENDQTQLPAANVTIFQVAARQCRAAFYQPR